MALSLKNRNIHLLVTLLRLAIGWHLLYEGVSKLVQGNWSAATFLLKTTGFFSPFYHWLASTPQLLMWTNFLNVYGLILIGLGLALGLFSRYSALAGSLLLTLYYFAYPPFGTLLGSMEGHLFIVDKLFIEVAVLIFLMLQSDPGYSLDNLILHYRTKKVGNSEEVQGSNSRREALKNIATIPVLGAMGFGAGKTFNNVGIDGSTGATIQVKQTPLNELKGKVPMGKIGKHEISRLVAGGNLLGGYTHSRDLLYVPSLSRAYNTEPKIFETLMLAEQTGINTINIGFASNPVLAKYKKVTGSKMKVISQVSFDRKKNNFYDEINRAIDFGADILQVQGNISDWMVRDNRVEVIGMLLDNIRKQGYTAGLAAHSVETLIACKQQNIIPDYYMKTMHHDQYWSAHPREQRVPFEVDGKLYPEHNRFHDNMFCLFPERTVEFVSQTTVPVMGYKVLAAGAIQPKDGFKWAFDNGADFICVGMFDFQLVGNVNIALETLNNLQRTRAWHG